MVQKRSCHETQELFIRCQIRDYGSRLFGAVGQVGLDPTLPDGITLVLQEAKDVIALGIDRLKHQPHLRCMVETNSFFYHQLLGWTGTHRTAQAIDGRPLTDLPL